MKIVVGGKRERERERRVPHMRYTQRFSIAFSIRLDSFYVYDTYMIAYKGDQSNEYRTENRMLKIVVVVPSVISERGGGERERERLRPISN